LGQLPYERDDGVGYFLALREPRDEIWAKPLFEFVLENGRTDGDAPRLQRKKKKRTVSSRVMAGKGGRLLLTWANERTNVKKANA
jgi:hypothetical protein